MTPMLLSKSTINPNVEALETGLIYEFPLAIFLRSLYLSSINS